MLIYFSNKIIHFTDKYQDRTEPIESKELTELFKFFNVEFPDDPLDESFARGILQNHTEKLVSLINSLSNGVVLTKNPKKLNSPSNKALMSEIDVVYEEGQFRVVKKVSAVKSGFFMILV